MDKKKELLSKIISKINNKTGLDLNKDVESVELLFENGNIPSDGELEKLLSKLDTDQCEVQELDGPIFQVNLEDGWSVSHESEEDGIFVHVEKIFDEENDVRCQLLYDLTRKEIFYQRLSADKIVSEIGRSCPNPLSYDSLLSCINVIAKQVEILSDLYEFELLPVDICVSFAEHCLIATKNFISATEEMEKSKQDA